MRDTKSSVSNTLNAYVDLCKQAKVCFVFLFSSFCLFKYNKEYRAEIKEDENH